MIRSRSLLWGVGLLAAAMLAGCASSPLSRIDSNRALYESWPLEIQEAVLEGRVAKGMTPEQVEMSVGKPSEKTSRNARNGMEEVWVYKVGGGGTGIPITVGTSVGGVGVVQQSRGGSGAEFHEIVFVDGAVVRSTLPE